MKEAEYEALAAGEGDTSGMNTAVINERRMLLKAIESKEDQYNAEFRMLRSSFSSPGYHTTIKQAEFIHSTSKSLIYALGLLDTGLARYERRAFDIIEQVISMQDTDRSRSTFGIWPWYYEESLDQMSPPDWNWADFCGKQLVMAVKRHGDRLPEGLRAAMREAICNACDAIIIRDVGPHYTNIAIMGAFVTLIAGELYGREDYLLYGLERLEKLAAYTKPREAFQEYNSPTYTYIAILELSKIASVTVTSRAGEICEELLDMSWESVGVHYHHATAQWSGPHSRTYRTLLRDETKAFLQLATGGALFYSPWEDLYYDEEWYLGGVACPAKHVPLFLASEVRSIKQCYEIDGKGGGKSATTFMTPEFTLGSFDCEIMWNQRRTLLAYIANGEEATYVNLRCLHDGYDYCSAVLHSDQEQGHALFGVGFLTSGGDSHPNLDRMDGRIQASDLRLRLEIGGCLYRVSAAVLPGNEGADILIHETPLKLRTWHAAFGQDDVLRHGAPLQWEASEADGNLFIDLVLYNGDRREIDFRSLKEAALAFSLLVGREDSTSFLPKVKKDGDRIGVSGTWLERELSLNLPARPGEW